jgi:hypothetical protein
VDTAHRQRRPINACVSATLQLRSKRRIEWSAPVTPMTTAPSLIGAIEERGARLHAQLVQIGREAPAQVVVVGLGAAGRAAMDQRRDHAA